jgi:hypothetical protein
MANDVIQAIETTEISRRNFVSKTLRFSVGAAGMIAGPGALVNLLAGCGSNSAVNSVDFSVTSLGDATNHSHNISILGTDLDNPPNEKTIPTTDVFQHIHEVTLSKADYEAIKNGQTVNKTSTRTGTAPHTHDFAIKKP